MEEGEELRRAKRAGLISYFFPVVLKNWKLFIFVWIGEIKIPVIQKQSNRELSLALLSQGFTL